MSMGSHVAKYCPWGVGALEHGRSYLLKTNRNTITIVFSLNYEITCSSHRLGEKKNTWKYNDKNWRDGPTLTDKYRATFASHVHKHSRGKKHFEGESEKGSNISSIFKYFLI